MYVLIPSAWHGGCEWRFWECAFCGDVEVGCVCVVVDNEERVRREKKKKSSKVLFKDQINDKF